MALKKWLLAGLMIEEVADLYGDGRYLLNNMIAKYTLAADYYAVSEKALSEFKRKGVDLSIVYTRSRFYGKKKGSNPFIYEHAIPATIIRDELLRCKNNHKKFKDIISNSGEVAVILRSEDVLLINAGLAKKMPDNWSFGDDPLARYHKVGITISGTTLKVKGAICR